MCMAKPGKILEINGEKGVVDFDGIKKKIFFSLIPDAVPGDWVLVHAGFAIERLSGEEAEETLQLFNEMEKATTNEHE